MFSVICFFLVTFSTLPAQTSVGQEDGGRKVPEHGTFVGLRRQTVAEQAECASTASTTSLHPAVAPQFRLVQTPSGHAKRDLQCTQSPVRLEQCMRGSVHE